MFTDIHPLEYRQCLEALADKAESLIFGQGKEEREAARIVARASDLYDPNYGHVLLTDVRIVIRGRRLKRRAMIAGARENIRQANEHICPID